MKKHSFSQLNLINRPWDPSRSIELEEIYILVDLELHSAYLMPCSCQNKLNIKYFWGLAWPGVAWHGQVWFGWEQHQQQCSYPSYDRYHHQYHHQYHHSHDCQNTHHQHKHHKIHHICNMKEINK